MSLTQYVPRLSILIICVLALFVATANAKPIYKWQDADGTTHYSSKPVTPQAQPAELPPITRGEVKLVKRKLISCNQHGGIDCQAGADTDGSVICYDGFRGPSARFRFSCNTPKLQISQISEVRGDGTFTVYVRNAKAVAASKPAILYHPNGGREVKLEGPAEIDAFGIAEFEYRPGEEGRRVEKVSLGDLDLTCANCP